MTFSSTDQHDNDPKTWDGKENTPGYSQLGKDDKYRPNHDDGKSDLKIRIGLDLELDLNVHINGQVYGEVVIGLVDGSSDNNNGKTHSQGTIS